MKKNTVNAMMHRDSSKRLELPLLKPTKFCPSLEVEFWLETEI